MTPELFTTSCLARIKINAQVLRADELAAELGWSIDRLRRVTRAYGVPLIEPEREPEPECEPLEPPPRRRGRGLPLNRAMDLQAILNAIPTRQSQVLYALAKIGEGGRWVSRAMLEERINGGVAGGSTMMALRHRLRDSIYEIQSQRSRKGGGFRLVLRGDNQQEPEPESPRTAKLNASMLVADILPLLPAREHKIMAVLAREMSRGGEPLKDKAIAARATVPAGSVNKGLQRLRDRLLDSRYRINFVREDQRRGYRMIMHGDVA